MATELTTRPRGVVGPPSGRATALYRFLLACVGVLARWVFAIRVEVRGREHLPHDPSGRVAGGWIAAPIPHVSWVDPFVVAMALPVTPRPMFLAAGNEVFRTRFRRVLFRLIGGLVPVWPGGGASAFAAHVEAAQQVIAAGAIFVIYPETARRHPPPDQPRTIEPGIGYIALRTGAPIVPIILGATSEIHRGRRVVVAIQPAQTATKMAGLTAGPPPEPGSSAEREAAHRIAEAFNTLTEPLVLAHHQEGLEYHAGMRRRWRWLDHWLG